MPWCLTGTSHALTPFANIFSLLTCHLIRTKSAEMPPKRKRAQPDAEASAPRTTRSSTRGTKKDGQGTNAPWSTSSR
ncbi:hypothetical protein BJV74DRAFT_813570 [Russula compacta]|nr:hypothetical protein BJV74DRAFT_813570 [Russula compacta]